MNRENELSPIQKRLISISSFCSRYICQKKGVPWDRLSQITIILFLIIGLNYAFGKAHFWGEADSYIIATISLQQHASLDVREGDIQQLEMEGYHSYMVEYAKNKFLSNRYYNDINKKQYPIYMGTYSISVIPIKMVNTIFNLSQTYVYQVSNVLFYSLALLVVYLCFRQTRKNIFLTILLLACSPVFVYISWASAEVFICSLMIISLVFFANRNHHLAALFMSVASTLNITICAFGLIILVDYFIFISDSEKEANSKLKIIAAISHNWKKVFVLAICFLPVIITPLWNLYHYRKITPQIGMAQFDVFWLKRFVSYLFDLNFGFLPYFPILLILFFIILIIGIYKKKRQIIMLALGFFIIVFLYSAMGHINCGMTAMSRYNSWSFPFLVIIVVSQFDKLFNNYKIRRIVFLLMLFSAGSTFALTKIVMDHNGGSYVPFTPIAKLFMDIVPALYNPYPFTFISRNEHYDGGYDRNAAIPFVYSSDDGFARKILIPPKCGNPVDFFEFTFSGAKNDIGWLSEQGRKLKANNPFDWTYLNIPSGRKIIYDDDNKDVFKELITNRKPEDYPSYKLGKKLMFMGEKTSYQTIGWSHPEEWGTWTEGKITVLVMCVDSINDLFLNLNISGLFNDKPIKVYINKVLIGSFEFFIGDNIIKIPKEIYSDKLLEIIFIMEDLKSPMDLGLSGDVRKLGIGVSSFIIEGEER
jgi:hypothetical protein